MGSWRYYLTLDGVNRAEDLVVSGTDSQQCFVAMWFSDEMDVFRKSIAKAIREAGYDPFIISMKEYIHRTTKMTAAHNPSGNKIPFGLKSLQESV